MQRYSEVEEDRPKAGWLKEKRRERERERESERERETDRETETERTGRERHAQRD